MASQKDSAAPPRHAFRGVYSAERAASLSGVPRSTVYYWARHGVWAPSLRDIRPKLWSYTDLLALRLIYWLRHVKPEADTRESSMAEVRAALTSLRRVGKEVWSRDVRVFADRHGLIFVKTGDRAWWGKRPTQDAFPEILDLLAEFPSESGILGPDLATPRPHLRIIPGKLGGEPHVMGTRIASARVAALIRDGLPAEAVNRLYPELSHNAVDECWDLERQLQVNLRAA
jgi:uncharacterized protein (DUF433 family)/DNA-binding transcriptional MerR regulator